MSLCSEVKADWTLLEKRTKGDQSFKFAGEKFWQIPTGSSASRGISSCPLAYEGIVTLKPRWMDYNLGTSITKEDQNKGTILKLNENRDCPRTTQGGRRGRKNKDLLLKGAQLGTRLCRGGGTT